MVRNSASHAYREIVINQNYFSSADDSISQTAIDAIQAASVITPPAITKQPVPVMIASGETARLKVVATGSSPKFQWYRGAVGNRNSPVNGGNAAILNTPRLKVTTKFWVRITNPAGSIRSKAVTVTVQASASRSSTLFNLKM